MRNRSYLCVARNARAPPAREVALVPELDEEALKQWRSSKAHLVSANAPSSDGAGDEAPAQDAGVLLCWDFDKPNGDDEAKTDQDARPYVARRVSVSRGYACVQWVTNLAHLAPSRTGVAMSWTCLCARLAACRLGTRR